MVTPIPDLGVAGGGGGGAEVDLLCYVERLGCPFEQMVMVMWWYHHDWVIDLEGGKQCRSSKMDLRFGGWYTRMNFLRNFLFRSVCLLDPSIFKRYWWNWRTSMTVPVRSQFVQVKTSLVLNPHTVTNRGNVLVCSFHCSC